MIDKQSYDFLKNLDIGAKALLIYSEKHPHTEQVLQQLKSLLEHILARASSVTVSISEGNILLDGEFIEKGTPVIDRLARDWMLRSIHSLTFHRGVTSEDLVNVLRSLSLRPQQIKQQGGFEAVLDGLGVRNIQANKLRYGIINEGQSQDQDLMKELIVALQTAVVRGGNMAEAAQTAESAANSVGAAAPQVLLDAMHNLAPSVNAGDQQNPELRSSQFVSLFSSFSPAMQARLLLLGLKQKDHVLSNLHENLSPEQLETVMQQLLQNEGQEPEVRELVSKLVEENHLVLSNSLQGRLKQLGFIEEKPIEIAVKWKDLLEAQQLNEKLLSQVPSAIAELLSAGDDETADRISRKVFSMLSAPQSEERIAAVTVMPTVISLLAPRPRWRNLDASATLLLGTCYRKEKDPNVMVAYLDFLLSALRVNFGSANTSACNNLLSTIRAHAQEQIVQTRLGAHISKFSGLAQHLRGEGSSTEVALNYLMLCGTAGVEYLCELLGDEEDRHVRSLLIGHLMRLDTDALLTTIQTNLSDRRWYVVRNMVTVVGKMALSEIPEFMAEAANHPDERVARELVKVLYKPNLRAGANVMSALLHHSSRAVRLQAVQLTITRGFQEAVPALLDQVMNSEAAETDIRAACLQALLKFRAPEALPAAMALLERKPAGRAEVAERNAAVRILGELQRAESKSLLEKIAQTDPNQETRSLAATYLHS